MPPSKPETKQLLERLIFADSSAQEWAQDVWDLNPGLGESAAKLAEVLDCLIEYCPADSLELFLQDLYQDQDRTY